MDEEFLEFSRDRGNDLITPVPHVPIPGSQALAIDGAFAYCDGKKLFEAGVAPQVVLASTHISTLEFVDMKDLVANAIDAPNQSNRHTILVFTDGMESK